MYPSGESVCGYGTNAIVLIEVLRPSITCNLHIHCNIEPTSILFQMMQIPQASMDTTF